MALSQRLTPSGDTMAQPKILPLILVEEGALGAAGLSKTQTQWASANGFSGQRGRLLALPSPTGTIDGHLFGVGAKASRHVMVTGLASAALEPGRYRLEGAIGDPTYAALGFRLGAYRFDRYKQ